MSIDRLMAGRTAAPEALQTSGRLSRLFVRDLVLPFRIGVYPQERLAPQRVRISLEVGVREPEGPLNDDIENVLSYDSLVGAIRALSERGHINLVETLADEIAAICLADARAETVRVTVEKLDVLPEGGSVGVEIERHRRRPSAASIYPLPSAVAPFAARRRDGQD